MAKPFIKWAGGKGYLITLASQKLSGISLPYCEPMVGGGAIFFALRDHFANHIIADVNPELINLYTVIRDNLDAMVAELSSGYEFVHKTDSASSDNYHRIRASRPTDPVKRAARILFLLKTCFNGLMRVNKSGHFNVPMGSYRHPKVIDIEVLGEFGDKEQVSLIEQLSGSEHKFLYTNRATDFILDNLRANSIHFDLIPLKHSIQPKHTTGMVESEVIAYRL